MLIRRHWFVLLKRLVAWFLAALIPFVIFLISGAGSISIERHIFFYAFLVVLASVYYLFIWLFIFNSFVDYYLDVWVVTNVRIIDIEQRQLFSRVISEHKLEKIQDITAEINGIIPTFLDYGEVFVQTAGEQQRFIFKQVSNPQNVKRKITSLCEYRKKSIKAKGKRKDIDSD